MTRKIVVCPAGEAYAPGPKHWEIVDIVADLTADGRHDGAGNYITEAAGDGRIVIEHWDGSDYRHGWTDRRDDLFLADPDTARLFLEIYATPRNGRSFTGGRALDKLVAAGVFSDDLNDLIRDWIAEATGIDYRTPAGAVADSDPALLDELADQILDAEIFR